MNVKRPDLPPDLSIDAGAEPPGSPSAREVGPKERFAEALARLEAETTAAPAGPPAAARSALARIARGVDLSDPAQAALAVRESARHLIRSRLGERHRQTAQGRRLVEALSEDVAADPLLKTKLLGILNKLQPG
ncbi:MAG TPA: hypothetical protein VFC61_11195 [Blastocatellia bacterium]|jgi:hypothetical protein|nr:hypothetical protein [Blastocatellia bacterium]